MMRAEHGGPMGGMMGGRWAGMMGGGMNGRQRQGCRRNVGERPAIDGSAKSAAKAAATAVQSQVAGMSSEHGDGGAAGRAEWAADGADGMAAAWAADGRRHGRHGRHGRAMRAARRRHRVLASRSSRPPPNWRFETRIPRARPVLKKLEEPISMSFAEETPLEDVLKYIKQATTSKTYQGIPIYVDPKGLKEADSDA